MPTEENELQALGVSMTELVTYHCVNGGILIHCVARDVRHVEGGSHR